MVWPKVAAIGTLVLAALASADTAQAQVFFSGYTNGRFCTACTNPNTSAYQTELITAGTNKMRYVNSTFSGTTVAGNLLLANGPAANNISGTIQNQNVNNFGSFHLSGGAGTYSSPFSLWVTFVDPTSTTLLFSGSVSGTIKHGNGLITIDFDPNTQGFSFNSGNGWASITVGDGTVLGEHSSSLTGVITAQVAPEPVTMSLIGTGLLGLAGAARRRRRKNTEDKNA